eukprot:TRINITY_DN128_c0_g1_i3.p1 TRINITY_DN128_c0_g1~~TRINITY_DN128_c0_g1_i3.p1  ORF type:complete len:363 (+),score=12.02 TRINITY_DN128_c0_g1_i3:140-1228(+)
MVLIILLLSLVSLASAHGSSELFAGENWETGNIQVRAAGDTLFYLLIRASNHNDTAPLIIWLNGGPGCSSMLGLFEEMGPYVIDKDTFEFHDNPHAWNKFSNMLYVDQPVGVGFGTLTSNSSICGDEACVARDFYKFLIGFMERYPEFMGHDLYLTGESFAGHYIPQMALYILKAKNSWLNLKGIALGNFATNLPIELQRFPLYMLENNLISFVEYIVFKAWTLVCGTAYELGVSNSYLIKYCGLARRHSGSGRIINPYDIRENVTYDPLDKFVQEYLKQEHIQKRMGINRPDYKMFNPLVYMKLQWDTPVSYSPKVEALLDSGMEVLMYFGDKDLICNWRAGEALEQRLQKNAPQEVCSRQ